MFAEPRTCPSAVHRGSIHGPSTRWPYWADQAGSTRKAVSFAGPQTSSARIAGTGIVVRVVGVEVSGGADDVADGAGTDVGEEPVGGEDDSLDEDVSLGLGEAGALVGESVEPLGGVTEVGGDEGEGVVGAHGISLSV